MIVAAVNHGGEYFVSLGKIPPLGNPKDRVGLHANLKDPI